MSPIRRCELPEGALLSRYSGSGNYTDCYSADVTRSVSHAEFIEAFYTTALFKLERIILAGLASRPSTDAQARQLAHGEIDSFAAWSVEDRAHDQLLLCDFAGRTRSWLMVSPAGSVEAPVTRLQFGSAVVSTRSSGQEHGSLGRTFGVLLGFHKLYSRRLLSAARSRLQRQQRMTH